MGRQRARGHQRLQPLGPPASPAAPPTPAHLTPSACLVCAATLQAASVATYTDAACKAAFPAGQILPGMMCAAAAGKDSCQASTRPPCLLLAVRLQAVGAYWASGPPAGLAAPL